MNKPIEIQPAIQTPPAIIPVMDLMIGQIVLARGGHRDQYTPIHTKLTTNSEPLAVSGEQCMANGLRVFVFGRSRQP